MKLIAILQVYNEVTNGNLTRCLESLSRYADGIVVYDDASTDNPFPLYEKYKCDVISAVQNDFQNELNHKQTLVDIAHKKHNADWIWRIDADEIIEPEGEKTIRELLELNVSGWAFHMVNLWRHEFYYRADNSFNDVVFNRLWRVPPGGLKFKVEQGLHKTNYPIGATDSEGFSTCEIIHYGFASDKSIIDKYQMYKKNGQSGPALDRLIDERTLRLYESKPTWFSVPPERPDFQKVYGKPLRKMI